MPTRSIGKGKVNRAVTLPVGMNRELSKTAYQSGERSVNAVMRRLVEDYLTSKGVDLRKVGCVTLLMLSGICAIQETPRRTVSYRRPPVVQSRGLRMEGVAA